MDDEDLKAPKNRLRWRETASFVRRRAGGAFTVLVTVAALILAILALLPETAELSYTITRTSMLTEHPDAEGLVAEYSFEGELVDQLWLVEVSMGNTGTLTLLGEGQIANILGEGLSASVPDHFRVLKASTFRNDPGAVITFESLRAFRLGFSQWRKGEVVEFALFVEATQPVWGTEPELSFPPRQLVDGRIRLIEPEHDAWANRSAFLDRLGRPAAATVRILGALVLAFLAFFVGAFLYLAVKDFKTEAKSHEALDQYKVTVDEWFASHPELDEETCGKLRSVADRPGRFIRSQLILDGSLSPELVSDFPRPPEEPTFSSWRSRTVGILCGIVVVVVLALVIAELVTSI